MQHIGLQLAPRPSPPAEHEYLERVLHNLNAAWAIEHAHHLREAAAIEVWNRHSLLEGCEGGEAKWGGLWPSTTQTRLRWPERGVKGTALAGWWHVVRQETVDREAGVHGIAAKRVQKARHAQLAQRRRRAATTVQRHTRGYLGRAHTRRRRLD